MNDLLNRMPNQGYSFHCTKCHGEHMTGTTYICSPTSSNLPCSKCQSQYEQFSNYWNSKNYNYCPHCGHKL